MLWRSRGVMLKELLGCCSGEGGMGSAALTGVLVV